MFNFFNPAEIEDFLEYLEDIESRPVVIPKIDYTLETKAAARKTQKIVEETKQLIQKMRCK
jgi:hypothetical protein